MSRAVGSQLYQSILRSQTNPCLSESQLNCLLQSYRSKRQKSFQQCLFNLSQQSQNTSLETIDSHESKVEQPPKRNSTVQISQHKGSPFTFMIAESLPGFKKPKNNSTMANNLPVLKKVPGRSFARRRLEYLPRMTSQIKADQARRTKIVIDLAEGGVRVEGNRIKIRYTKIIQETETSQNIVFLNSRPEIWSNLNSQRSVVQEIIQQRIVDKQGAINLEKKDKIVPTLLNVTETTNNQLSQHKKQVDDRQNPQEELPKIPQAKPSSPSVSPKPSENNLIIPAVNTQSPQSNNQPPPPVPVNQPKQNPFLKVNTGQVLSYHQIFKIQGNQRPTDRQILNVKPPQTQMNIFATPTTSVFRTSNFQSNDFLQPQQQQQMFPNTNTNFQMVQGPQRHNPILSQVQNTNVIQHNNNIQYQASFRQIPQIQDPARNIFSRNNNSQASALGLDLNTNTMLTSKASNKPYKNNNNKRPSAYR